MHFFSPANFFFLEKSHFLSLFAECVYVWDAFEKISSYIETFPLGTHNGVVSPDAYLIHPEKIFIDEGVIVEPGAYIQGPCVLGKGSVVRHGAYLRGNVITEENCVIGHTTEVKNSIFLKGAKAAHFAYVGDSILGNDVNLGAGTKLANLRMDRKTIYAYTQMGEKIDTGRKKIGAILGDGAQTGCNVVTNPGTFLLPSAMLLPLQCGKGVVG